MIIFKNKGVIDIRAISTFGCSVKKEGSIGFFGTGLKYAISILLREGCAIDIYAGGSRFAFTKKPVEVTGQPFDVVCMNDKELGFTTDLGKTWLVWQAFRELYCNCTDEGGEITKDNDFSCGPDETVITVQGAVFEDIFDNLEKYILKALPDLVTESCDIHLRSADSCYYRGVHVKDKFHSVYTYNIKDKIDLTEDRTAKYDFQLGRAVAKAITSLDDEQVIEQLVCAPEYTIEGQLEYDIFKEPSAAYLKVCERLVSTQCKKANKKAIAHAKKYADLKEDLRLFEPDPLQWSMVRKAQELLMITGYSVAKYEMVFVESLGQGVLAQAKNGKMYITRRCFEKGTKLVAHALLEEFFHNEHGFEDETREFQTFLFDNILTLIERLNQEAF
jgi:hypothetical protein